MDDLTENKNRILRFLGRLDKYKDIEAWKTDANVAHLYDKRGGIDLAAIREQYNERKFLSYDKFDEAYTAIKQAGEAKDDTGIDPTAIAKYEMIEREQMELNRILEEAKEM